jgi:chromosome partitioning protein
MVAIGIDAEKREKFEQLFAKPKIDTMLELTPLEFELFVAYVFESAGYIVEHIARTQYPQGPGVDLNLYTRASSNRPVARIEVRRYHPGNLLDFDDVAAFFGKLMLPNNRRVPGIMVTTSGFTKQGRKAAEEAGRKVQLIDGNRLLRYITYIGGSRVMSSSPSSLAAQGAPITPSWLRTGEVIARRTAKPSRKTHVLAIMNTKGGVAKTTTALNLAFALADQHNKRTLLIDLDGQGSVTHSLPQPFPSGTTLAQAKILPPPPDTRFISDYFLGHAKLSELTRPTRFTNLSLIPAKSELYRLEFSGAERPKTELHFMEDVRTLAVPPAPGVDPEPFEWILFDTPAGDTPYGRAALAAADYVLVPAYTEAYAKLGITETVALTRTIGALTTEVEHGLDRLLGCVITRWKSSVNANTSLAEIVFMMQHDYTSKVYGCHIPLDDKVETAHRGTMQGKPRSIFRLTNTLGPAARAYDKLAKEIIEDVNSREAQA